MLQALTQWVLTHIRGVTLTLTVTTSAVLLVRSSRMDLTPVRWGMVHLLVAGQRVFRIPIHLASLGEENRYLRSRLLERVLHETQLRELQMENSRLRAMLDYRRERGLELLAARVLAHDGELPPTTITVDVGRMEGVGALQAVVSPEGLVGRTDAEPAAHTSLVRLITDPGLRVSVVLENPQRVMGILSWDGTRMTLKNVPQEALLSEGDRVVTSGVGGVFPPGLYVGYVAEIVDDPHALFKEITVAPGARVDRLEEVFVVRSRGGNIPEAEASDAMDR